MAHLPLEAGTQQHCAPQMRHSPGMCPSCAYMLQAVQLRAEASRRGLHAVVQAAALLVALVQTCSARAQLQGLQHAQTPASAATEWPARQTHRLPRAGLQAAPYMKACRSSRCSQTLASHHWLLGAHLAAQCLWQASALSPRCSTLRHPSSRSCHALQRTRPPRALRR